MAKRTRKIFATIAIVLCATIGLSLPIEVFASTLPTDENSYSSFDNVQDNSETDGNIISEISESRTENTKEFLLDNGTKMIAQYNQPVHYKDDNGEWVEYDNSLIDASKSTATDDEVSVYSDDFADEYTNQSSNIKVNYSKKSKENNMIKVKANDYSISWGYKNTNKVNAKIVKKDEKLEGNDKYTVLQNQISETVYENIYNNVDICKFSYRIGI